jgi:hypothetical protein
MATGAIFATLVNGRGTLQIIIATVALRDNVISPVLFTVIVTGALITSLFAAPVARAIKKGPRWCGGSRRRRASCGHVARTPASFSNQRELTAMRTSSMIGTAVG